MNLTLNNFYKVIILIMCCFFATGCATTTKYVYVSCEVSEVEKPVLFKNGTTSKDYAIAVVDLINYSGKLNDNLTICKNFNNNKDKKAENGK